MNTFMSGLKEATNLTYTENGAISRKSTQSKLMDMFAFGGAYRQRSDEDVILLFKNAYDENPEYALKCLFYTRDIRGGQGERRFFRVCLRWLATYDQDAVRRNLTFVPEYGRWDDLFVLFGTGLESEALKFIRDQLILDTQCKTPSLLAKWMPSENASSKKSYVQANTIRKYLGWTHKQYRKTLSVLRSRINVLERLMSAGEWDKIEFDKIPSKAGILYKNAFARHDVERMKAGATKSYEEFAKDTTTKVNAKALYPADVVSQAIKVMGDECSIWYHRYGELKHHVPLDDVNRLMVNKYWENLADYFQGASFNGICVCDTSGSMTIGNEDSRPIDVAISLALYCAERNSGPFAGHYISFASRPQLIATEGVDFCDKVARIYRTNLVDNTNIEAVFDLLLDIAVNNKCHQSDLPRSIIVVSDMEFDAAQGYCDRCNGTLMENIAKKWERAGFTMPNLIFWNVNARQNLAAMEMKEGISFVSGYSPVLFDQIMSGKTGYDLMMDKLNSDRYAPIH